MCMVRFAVDQVTTRLGINSRFCTNADLLQDANNVYYSAMYKCDANNLYGFCMTQKLPIGGFSEFIPVTSNFQLTDFINSYKKTNYGFLFLLDPILPDDRHETSESIMSSFFTFYKVALNQCLPYQLLCKGTAFENQKILKS